MYPKHLVETVVQEYQTRTDLTGQAIAEKHGVSYAALLSWLRAANVPQRRRGRRKQTGPTLRQQHILALVKVYSYAEVGRLVGRCRSDIWRIVERWGLPEVAKPPFKPGDVITFSSLEKSQKFRVVKATVASAVVVCLKTGQKLTRFSWWRNNKMAHKVGGKTEAA